nr:uncharacterized mitochondrial protein AtMg00810-like [Tanacetum cinerariifolium]
MQTQTSNTLHNAIMEAGGKDRSPMLAPGNYVQWKSRIKRYIDTKPNNELIHYCLKNPPYKYKWVDKTVLVSEGIDNDIYATVDAYPNACEMWKAIERLNQGESINVQDLETNLYWEFRKFTSRDGNVAGARETVGTTVVPNNDNYNVFAMESEHSEQYKSVNDTYPIEQDEHNMIIDSGDMSYDREQINQDDDDALANEHELLASLIEKLKCEIDDSKNRNKFLETSNKVLVDKLKETNELMYNDLKKFQAELDKRNDVKNKKELFAHQETISILSQAKEAQIKLYKTREDKELDKVINLENKVKVLDNIVYKTCQSVQIINMLNSKCRTSFAKHEFLKKAQRANPRLYDIGVIPPTSVSRPRLKSNRTKDRVMLNNSQGTKQEVEDHRRNVKLSKNKMFVTACNDSLNAKNSNVNFVCATCVLNVKHDKCVLYSRNSVNSRTKMPIVVPVSTREPKRTVNKSVAKPLKKIVALELTGCLDRLERHCILVRAFWFLHFVSCNLVLRFDPTFCLKTSCVLPEDKLRFAVKHVAFCFKARCIFLQSSLHFASKLVAFCFKTRCVLLQDTLRFASRHAAFCFKTSCVLSQDSYVLSHGGIAFRLLLKTLSVFSMKMLCLHLGYGDLVQGAITIKRVYYVEGMNHNLFSVGQFCDADLEVAFRKSTCYIRDLKGNDLLTGSSRTDLYSITLHETSSPNLICLMAKATSSQAWLWHRRLSHLNFDTINLLSKNDIVIGLPKLKFIKDHLCSSCELGKSKIKSFHTNTTLSSKRQLQLLHMDLCGPMLVESINGKKYVLVIVDDYSRYTWTHFLRSKDETPEVLIDFLRLVQRGLHAPVRIVRTDKGTEFLNKTLQAYFASKGINRQTSVARTPEQNSIVKRQNRTLVEAARTMLSAAKSRAYSVFNKRTRVIVETIHVNFDELPQLASDHVSSDPEPQCPNTELEHDRLSFDPQSQENVPQVPGIVTTSNELDLLFSLMFDELLNGSTQVVLKSSAVTTADTLNQCQQQHTTPWNTQTTPEPTCQVPTQAPTVTSTENINQAEAILENAHVEDDEFINIFSTPVQDRRETSSRHVDSLNMHTFYQRHPFEHCWTKDHSLEQVIGNPSQSVRTRRQLESDGEMCMFALTVSRTEPKNIKEALVDSAWIESMQEELHQFDRLDEGVDFEESFAPIAQLEAVRLFIAKFEMSMMGKVKLFLGIQIHQSHRGIFINQSKYAQEILIKHGMTSCDSVGTPMATKNLDADLSGTPVDQMKYRSMVRELVYLTVSRPDIVHATCYCARYQAKPTEKHLSVVKRIFRYLKDTINMGLWYPKDIGFELTTFSDSDHAGCPDSRKSTSGGIQFLGGDKLVNWSSKKQDCTSMSLAEAEYVSLSACCAQVLWMRTQLTDYGFHFDKIPMYCNSKAATAISCNPVLHSRTKHIDVRYHFIKEKVEKGIVE